MDPSTAMTMMTVAKTGSDVMTANAEAKAQSRAYEYNASLAEQQAANQERLKHEEASQALRNMRSALSRQTALYGASGVKITGAPITVQNKTVENTLLDIEANDYNRDVAASQFRSQAESDRTSAKLAKLQGRLKMGRALIGGISDYMSYSGGLGNSVSGMKTVKTGIIASDRYYA